MSARVLTTYSFINSIILLNFLSTKNTEAIIFSTALTHLLVVHLALLGVRITSLALKTPLRQLYTEVMYPRWMGMTSVVARFTSFALVQESLLTHCLVGGGSIPLASSIFLGS